MKKLIWVLLTLVIISSLAVTGCNGTEETVSSTPSKTSAAPLTTTETAIDKHGGVWKYLAMMAPGTPIGWPAESRTGDTIPCLEGFAVEDDEGNLTPWLATDWKLAPDKLSMEISLRKGVKFHDGTDFDAAAAKFAMEGYMEGHMAPLWKSIEIIDDYTIRLNFNRWENGILSSLSARIFISPTAYEKNGLDWVRWNPVGTGAFKFVSFTRDTSLIFTRNDDWWNKGSENLPYLDGMEIYYFADKTAEYNAFLAGSGQAARMLSVQQSSDLADRGYIAYSALNMGGMSGGGVTYLAGDSNNPDSPFANQKVREALEYAIDKDAICAARGFGFWKATDQFAAFGSPDTASGIIVRDYDPEKAKQLLADAGYPNGFETRIIPDPALTDKDAATAVQNFLRAVGIDAELEMVDYGKFNDYSQNGWKNALLMPSTMFSPNFANAMKGGFYTTRFGMVSVGLTDEWIALLEDALATPEIDHAKEQACIKYINETSMIIPIFAHHEPYVLTTDLHDHGFFSLAGVLDWTPWIAWLEK